MSFNLEETVSLDEASNNMITDEGKDVNGEEKRLDVGDFHTDHTVPLGWSYKGVLASGKHFQLKCPLGNIYRSRADAFAKMYSSGKYSTKEIELIKDSLKYEGWEENETIPNGWRIKRDKNSSIFLLEQGGKRFLSSTKVCQKVQKILF